MVAATDSDPDKIGTVVDGVPVHAPGELGDIVRRLGVAIGVISTPAEAAQGTADALVAAGVTSIMSFAPTVLSAPDEVEIRSVDLATELQILGFHLHRDRIAGDS